MTEPLEPYEPTESHDLEWEYDREHEEQPRVLWGRVAVLAGMLLLAFFIGRMTKSAGVPESDLTKAESKVTQLEQQNEDLKTELAAAQAAKPETDAADAGGAVAEDGATDETATEGSASGEAEGMNYTVKAGDTLTTIAAEFYDDPSLDDFLAEYNEITDPSSLAVGQIIFLPDDTTP